MKTILLAEKPSMARDIASVIGSFTKRQGYLENTDYLVTWAIGHLAELANPEDYSPELKTWNLDTLPIIPAQFLLKPAERTIDQWRVVKSLLQGKHRLVINACDAGREGELIFQYIYHLAGCRLPIMRLWLSENTPGAIRKALENLQDPQNYYHLSLAAMARSQADWLIGINGTRAFTLAYKKSGQKGSLSIGRVQTPTLALIVEREKEIRSFIPEQWWEVYATFQTDENRVYRGRWIDK